MTISSIAGATSLLISAVKPPVQVPPLAALPDRPEKPSSVKITGQLNTFALSVLANVLESEQSLLDGKDHTKDAQNVVDAGQALASSQQVAFSYAAAQAITQTKSTPVQMVII